MPNGRTVLLLRRLSSGDSKLKNLPLNQNNKEPLGIHPLCSHRDIGVSRRLSTFGNSTLKVTQNNLNRSFSDQYIKMSSSGSELPQNDSPKHTNRLLFEKSPYLRQHAHNPVDWYPWCQEALDKAKKENKLIFLSVGYSTCHWCHVMERESFENEDIARVMNENFVNIKVDREERPDIDRVYMLFILATVGRGGWPMSVFITPDLKPVTGGTYFPPTDHLGRPGFKTVLLSISTKWKNNHEKFIDASNNILEVLQKISIGSTEQQSEIPGEPVWISCMTRLRDIYEPHFGGFGLAPKFPQASILNFLFHFYARDKNSSTGKECLQMCLHTLTKMAKGGIHDHISSGFARYSVDNDWHVPHFEKMLYDQAQLTIAYTDAYLATKNEFYADIVRDIIKYVNRDLRHEFGGYYSAEDADSYPYQGAPQKKEGAFCVWEYDELKKLLDDKKINTHSYLDVFCDYFSVEAEGNISIDSDPHNELQNKNVLIIYGSSEETAEKFGLTMEEFKCVIAESVDILYEARQKRPRPHLDTKILCSWNGLMIAGLAQAGQALTEKNFVDDAIKAAVFIKQHLYNETTKTLLHSCYKGEDGQIAQIENPISGFLEDYAYLIKGLLDLYEASLDPCWLDWAGDLQATQDRLFWDDAHGGYFTCSGQDKNVIMRLKDDQDNAEPSGNSVSCHNLLRLGALADKSARGEAGDAERSRARRILQAFAGRLRDAPTSLPHMMAALMFYTDSPTQVVIAGGSEDPRTLELARAVRSRLLPGRVLAVADPADAAHIVVSRAGAVDAAPAAYVCRRYACSLPVTSVKDLEELLDQP